MNHKEDKLVWVGYLVLLVYNAIALTGVFEKPISEAFHKFYLDNLGTLSLLEFFIVAALFVNMILNYDKFKGQKGVIHLALTAICLICFFIKLVFFFMGVFKQV